MNKKLWEGVDFQSPFMYICIYVYFKFLNNNYTSNGSWNMYYICL